MKKIVLTLLILLTTLTSHLSRASVPNQIFVIEHWISLTKSYDIKTSDQKLGTLYRRFLTFPMSYDFYDLQDTKTATAKARFFSWGAYLDIYDQSSQLLGSVKEKLFTLFPSFEILTKDNTKLAQAEMNAWGTKFYIYDPITN